MRQARDFSVLPVIYSEMITVTDDDADEFGHANNTRNVHWMQQIATNHSADLGWTSERYLRYGAIWVARRHTIDYIHPVFPGETMKAETWVCEMKNVSSIRRYRFTRVSDDELIATAETLWAFVSSQTGHPIRIPEEIKNLFPLQVNTQP